MQAVFASRTAGRNSSSVSREGKIPGSSVTGKSLAAPGRGAFRIGGQRARSRNALDELTFGVPVTAPDATVEREAEQTADQVLNTPVSAAFDAALPRTREPSPPSTPVGKIHEALGTYGQGLDGTTRAYFEARFHRDLGHVRLHTDPSAHEAARALHADAYAFGSHIVFGAAQYSPGTSQGRRLLAHELAHVTQDRDQGVIARQPVAPTPSQSRSFGIVFYEFNRAREFGGPAGTGDIPKAQRLARELLEVSASQKELVDHAVDIALWAQDHGLPDVRDEMLARAERAWFVEFVSEKGKVPAAGSLASRLDGPEALVEAAEQTARAGDHSGAAAMFGLAHLLYSFQIVELTRTHSEALHGGRERWPAAVATAYPDAQHVYDGLREIYAFYPQLEREALQHGDRQQAAALALRGKELRSALKDHWSLDDVGMVAEVSEVETPIGPGLRLHGANSAETDLTALPGLPTPKEIGDEVQAPDLADTQQALALQADFMNEVTQVPEVQKAFKGGAIDINDLQQRLQLWKVMLQVFQRSGDRPLAQLMDLIGRYLKAFTIHTQYNVRDWGDSYIDTVMPTDLAGRAERDCGVYALMVAWETFKTVKETDRSAAVSFELVAMLDHVTLLIRDKTRHEWYLVNNDEITGPRPDTADPLLEIGKIWAKLSKQTFVVGPAATVPLGATTTSGVSAFRTGLWKQYQDKAQLNLRASLPAQTLAELNALKRSDPEAFARQISEIRSKTYEDFYAREAQLDVALRGLNTELDQILRSPNPDAALQGNLTTITAQLTALVDLFLSLAPAPGNLPIDAGGQLFGMFSQTDKTYPLVRGAMGLLRLEHRGGTLTQEQQAVINFCDAVPVFHAALERFRRSGMPASF
jgi:Domain of unknown function (DUF4157)